MKAPAFQFYPNDFEGDAEVKLLDNEQLGAYVRLMCVAWGQIEPGYLPLDDEKLSKWTQTGKRWAKHRTRVLACFKVTEDGRLMQKRLVEEHAKQQARRQERKEAGARGLKARWGDRDVDSSAMAQPSIGNGTAIKEPMANDSSSSSSSSSSPERSPEEALSRAPACVAGPMPRSAKRGVAAAWSNAGLPGLPDSAAIADLSMHLLALNLNPDAACKAFKQLLDAWRDKRGVLVKPIPAKMVEHLPFVQQILAGELDVAVIGKAPASNGKSTHVGFTKIDDEVHVEGDRTDELWSPKP